MVESPSNRRDFLAASHLRSYWKGVAPTADDLQEAAAVGDRLLQRFSAPAMGSEFEVYFDAQRFPQAAAVALEALERVRQLEAILSTYREDSAVAQVNRTAGWGPVHVPSEVIELLEAAQQVHEQTQGAFDITSGPLSKLWGFYYRKPRVPAAIAIAEALKSTGFHHVRWDPNQLTVTLGKAGIELNFASIGKGYALDAAARLLTAAGVEEFVVQGGQSSVLARSAADQDSAGWVIGVLHPLRANERLGTIDLYNQALATSGSQRQSLIHEGRRLGHVLDPRSGWPATHILSATVVGESAAETDALATAFCVMGIEQITDFATQRPDVGAVIVRPRDQSADGLVIDVFNPERIGWRPSGEAL